MDGPLDDVVVEQYRLCVLSPACAERQRERGHDERQKQAAGDRPPSERGNARVLAEDQPVEFHNDSHEKRPEQRLGDDVDPAVEAAIRAKRQSDGGHRCLYQQVRKEELVQAEQSGVP